MNKRRVSIALMFAVVLLIVTPATAKTKQEKQAEVRKNAEETLNRLFKARPSAKAAIKAAAGYAAFSNFGMKILIAGGGKGNGVAFDNRTGKFTYMKMLEVQAGLGGRHLAAASITRASRAIAIVVSSSGTIRVFKGGRAIMVVGRT